MSRFIPIDKMRTLREKAKAGDEKAKRIIRAQMDDEDFSELIEDYFKPQEKPVEAEPTKEVQEGSSLKTNLEKFLEYNGVKEGDPDYEETVEMFYNENPQEKPTEPSEPEENPEESEGKEDKIDVLDSLIEKAREFIHACDDAIMDLADGDETGIAATTLKGAMDTLGEAKQSALEILKKTKDMKESVRKKEDDSALISEENDNTI